MGYMRFDQKMGFIVSETGMPVDEIARRSGINRQTLHSAIQRNSALRGPSLVKLAKALNIDPAWFYDEGLDENYLGRHVIVWSNLQGAARGRQVFDDTDRTTPVRGGRGKRQRKPRRPA